ncbi:uncharacterized protein LOC132701565 [Cylas formicarius]|uniref:uncharacterized protein LOC132701565 n=1 Tax=Cylas formicarius TaxID=197179 RepID=UPI002958CC37|nr:uncharacterized protein LOC132701565 [Cylas formicarius]
MDFKDHRKVEQKVHQTLYANLDLLTRRYPTRKEFKAIFRKDMFVKNNKAAFFEVMYYLLEILDPQLVKEKLISWPPYDPKQEPKCRNEILKCINELNSRFENADIPLCQASSLISPGGYRFAKFLLKISELALYEYLCKNTENDILYKLKVAKNSTSVSKNQLNNLRKETNSIERETKMLYSNFKHHYIDLSEQALELHENIVKLDADTRKAKIEYQSMTKEFNLKFPLYPSLESIRRELEKLQKQTQTIQSIYTLLEDCDRLVESLKHSELRFDPDSVQSELQMCVIGKGQIDLAAFFREVSVFIERHLLKLPNFSPAFLNKKREQVQNSILQYNRLSTYFDNQHGQLTNLMEDLHTELR